MPNKLTADDLRQFTGTENYYRHATARNVLYTDGVKSLAERGGAYWLIDAIASHITGPVIRRSTTAQEFSVWRLTVAEDRSAVLTARIDDDGPDLVRQEIRLTDFPLQSVDVWASHDGEHWILYLPSEH